MEKENHSAAKVSKDCPLWRNTSLRLGAWRRLLKTSEYLCRFIQFGIRDMPSVPFSKGEILPAIPQTEEDKEFGLADLDDGIRMGVYEEVTRDYVTERVKNGLLCSSAFTVWQGEGEERKGRFVLNFHRQSKHWCKGSIKMETVPSFSLEMERGDMMLSFDVKAGYRHFFLHPDMRDFFLFHYAGRYFRCIALPFGWGRSPMWFTKMMRGFVRYMREKMCYRVLPYIDDFLVAPSPPGRPATERDVSNAQRNIARLMRRLGITRKVGKGCWDGSRQIDHLGVHIDSDEMKVYVADNKVSRVRALARKLIRQAHRNRRMLPADTIRRFCGVCVSLSLALPLARFYTRSLYFDLSGAEMGYRSSRSCRRPLLHTGERRWWPYIPWRCPAQSPIASRPAMVAQSHSWGGPCSPTRQFWHDYAQRCLRRGVRRDVGIRYHRWYAGFVGESRFMVRKGSAAVDYTAGAQSGTTSARPILCRVRVRPRDTANPSARRQPSGCVNHQRHGIRQQAHDGGVTQAQRLAARIRHRARSSLDTDGCESIRGCVVTNLESGRCAGLTNPRADDPRTVSPWTRHIRPFSHGRHGGGKDEADSGRTRKSLGRWARAIMEPTGGFHPAGRPQTRTGTTARCVARSLLASPVVVRAVTQDRSRDHSAVSEPESPSLSRRTRSLASRHRADQLKRNWQAGIRHAVLAQAGFTTNTGGAEAAAMLLAEFGWAQSTWSTRASQVAKWLRFCDEDMRPSLPATEGDVLSYIGFLSIEGKVSPESLPQYLSAVSRYHELHHLPSPTKSPLVSALQKAYRRAFDDASPSSAIRVGCPASVMRRIVTLGFHTSDAYDMACCAITIFAFVFQVRSVSVQHLRRQHVSVDSTGIRATIYRRKGKSIRRPLLLLYGNNPSWQRANPVSLLYRWTAEHYDSHIPLGEALHRALILTGQTAPEGCFYSAHSPRIGGYNELLSLQFPKEWIMRRLDWEAEEMLRVYSDTTITVTEDSRWFFAHLRPEL